MVTCWGKNGTRTRVIENILKPDGNRISAQVDYEYDGLCRLVHEHRIAHSGGDPGVAYEYNFAYDDAGNRTSWQTVGGSTISYAYDAANKMTSPGTFTYDDKGNTLTHVVGGVTTTYTWDYLNRMTQWQRTGETTQTYVYNADGMRVRVTPSGGTATNFLLDIVEIAEEITGANVTSYVGPGLIGRIASATRTIYHADGTGSTRAMSDCGTPVAITEMGIYDAYGNANAIYGNEPSFGYAGQHRYYADSTDLDYLKARYYDPATGRFTSRDPIGYAGGMNLYAYTHNDPVNNTDPSGLEPEKITAKMCRDACENRGYTPTLCRAACKVLSSATCVGMYGAIKHCYAHNTGSKTKVCDALYAAFMELGCKEPCGKGPKVR